MCPETKFDRVVTFNRNFNVDREQGPKNLLQWAKIMKISRFYCLAQQKPRAPWDLEGAVVGAVEGAETSANVSSTKRYHMYGYVETDNISDL